MSALATSVQRCKSPSQAKRHGNETKGIQTGKEEVRPYSNDMTLYTENPKKSAKKLLELIHKLSNVAGYKMNIFSLLYFHHWQQTI